MTKRSPHSLKGKTVAFFALPSFKGKRSKERIARPTHGFHTGVVVSVSYGVRKGFKRLRVRSGGSDGFLMTIFPDELIGVRWRGALRDPSVWIGTPVPSNARTASLRPGFCRAVGRQKAKCA